MNGRPFPLPAPLAWAAFFVCLAAAPSLLRLSGVDGGGAVQIGALNDIGVYLILALSLNIILGHAGLFHMGHTAFFAVGAYTSAILNSAYGWPILSTIPAAGLLAALFALLVAVPIIRLRGDYLLVVTIGVVEIVRIILLNDVFGLTGGANGLAGISRPELFGLRLTRPEELFYLIWTCAGLTIILFSLLENSRFGRALNYIKQDEVAAAGCGVNIHLHKIQAFALGAFWAGMAGTLLAVKMRLVDPESFTFSESVLLFAIVILGGSGSIAGVVLGSFLLIGLQEIFRDFSQARMLAFGAAMVAMMVFRPQGLIPAGGRRYDVRGLAGVFPCALGRLDPAKTPGQDSRGQSLPPDYPRENPPERNAASSGAVCSGTQGQPGETRKSRLLELKNLFKAFDGLAAVAGISFEVEEGAIVGLIGPNGAGKTTVFNLITGNARPDSGEIFFDSRRITGLSPHGIVRLGIARTFQNVRLFQELSVLENALAGRHCRMRCGLLSSMLRPPFQQREEKSARERAMRELAFVGLDGRHGELAGSLPFGRQRLLEIARALASDPRFLILDEPAGGMNDQETAELMGLIAAIQARGITVLLIEHDMNLVMKICRKIVVLDYGAVIAKGAPEQIKKDPLVIDAYLGSDE